MFLRVIETAAAFLGLYLLLRDNDRAKQESYNEIKEHYVAAVTNFVNLHASAEAMAVYDKQALRNQLQAERDHAATLAARLHELEDRYGELLKAVHDHNEAEIQAQQEQDDLEEEDYEQALKRLAGVEEEDLTEE